MLMITIILISILLVVILLSRKLGLRYCQDYSQDNCKNYCQDNCKDCEDYYRTDEDWEGFDED